MGEHPWNGLTERRKYPDIPERLASLEAVVKNIHEDLQALRPRLSQLLMLSLVFVGVLLTIIAGIGKIAVLDPFNRLESQVVALDIRTGANTKEISKLMADVAVIHERNRSLRQGIIEMQDYIKHLREKHGLEGGSGK